MRISGGRQFAGPRCVAVESARSRASDDGDRRRRRAGDGSPRPAGNRGVAGRSAGHLCRAQRQRGGRHAGRARRGDDRSGRLCAPGAGAPACLVDAVAPGWPFPAGARLPEWRRRAGRRGRRPGSRRHHSGRQPGYVGARRYGGAAPRRRAGPWLQTKTEWQRQEMLSSVPPRNGWLECDIACIHRRTGREAVYLRPLPS